MAVTVSIDSSRDRYECRIIQTFPGSGNIRRLRPLTCEPETFVDDVKRQMASLGEDQVQVHVHQEIAGVFGTKEEALRWMEDNSADLCSSALVPDAPSVQQFASYARELQHWITTNLSVPLSSEFGMTPSEVNECLSSLDKLLKNLSRIDQGKQRHVYPSAFPALKRAIIHARRNKAHAVERKKALTFHAELRTHLDRGLDEFATHIASRWFKDTAPMRVPRITDFVLLEYAESKLDTSHRQMLARVYDEKWRILTAPTLFLHDLDYYRVKCDLRRVDICVAHIDIDHFKSFNTKYNEARVDRDVLPRFMSALESHVFCHGHAYRFGGDEYMLLLPNCSQSAGVAFLRSLQERLRSVHYPPDITDRPTVSIGLCSIDDSSYYTDYEVYECAAQAKAFAKMERDCIATYTHGCTGELYIIHTESSSE